jgi:hypothetical protein
MYIGRYEPNSALIRIQIMSYRTTLLYEMRVVYDTLNIACFHGIISKDTEHIRNLKSCRCSHGITIMRRIAAVCGVNAAYHIAVAVVDGAEPFKIIAGGFVWAARKRILDRGVLIQLKLQPLCRLPTHQTTNHLSL